MLKLELHTGTRAIYHDCIRKESLIAGQWPCHLLDNSQEETGDDRSMLSMLNNVCEDLSLDWIPLTSCSVIWWVYKRRAIPKSVQIHGKHPRYRFKHMLHVNHFFLVIMLVTVYCSVPTTNMLPPSGFGHRWGTPLAAIDDLVLRPKPVSSRIPGTMLFFVVPKVSLKSRQLLWS